MKRNKGVVLAAAGIALTGVLALSACGGGHSGETSTEGIEATDDGATLSLWVRPGNEAVTDAIVEAYNDSHENTVEITHVPADQYVTKYAQSAQSGSLPDILAADLVFMPQIVDNGTALDLTDLLEKSGAAGNLTPAHVQASSSDGRIYGVPYVSDTSLYLYNKTLFEEVGLDPDVPPTTWEGIAAAADKISDLGDDYYGAYISGNAPGSLAYSFTPMIWAQDQQIVTDAGGFDFDNKATQSALKFMQDLYENGDIPTSSKTDGGDGFFSVFATGKIGFNFSGGNGVNTATLGADPEFDFGLAPIPGPEDGQWATFSGGDAVAISAQSENKNQAWDFVDWLTSSETSNDVYLSLPALPPRTDVEVPAEMGEQFTVPAELAREGQTYVTTNYNEAIASAQGPWVEMFQSVVFDGVDPATATATAQAAADEITE